MGAARKALAWLLVPVICMGALFYFLARPFNPDNNRRLGWVLARVGRRVLGIERPLIGADNMPRDRPTVIIANHQQNDDLFLVGDLLPPRTVIVGKSALRWLPFFGQVFWLGGNVFINRSRGRHSVGLMQAASAAIMGERKSLWVFPEGTRGRGQRLQTFKKGAFHVAIATGAPITMVCVGRYQGVTAGHGGSRQPVSIRILPPVETRDLTSADLPSLMARCHQQMDEAIEALAEPRAGA